MICLHFKKCVKKLKTTLISFKKGVRLCTAAHKGERKIRTSPPFGHPFQERQKKALLKGNSPVRGNVCKADKRVPVSGRKAVRRTEGSKHKT